MKNLSRRRFSQITTTVFLTVLAICVSSCFTTDPALDTTGELTVTDVRVGMGDVVPLDTTSIAQLTISYTEQLRDSTVIAGRTSVLWVVGNGSISPASLEPGLRGMRVGGTRRIVIPPRLAYQNKANGNIPANSTLVYTVNLTNVENFVVQDVVIGTGDTAKVGSTLGMRYVGKLTNGVIFDASIATESPFSFRLGTGAVIKGWDFGIPGMRVGGKRRLVIPSQLGYGTTGSSTGRSRIPPNATLLFDVELVSVSTSQ
jgi:FKBP-type peptidyl-prolyl cis-trans isomerase